MSISNNNKHILLKISDNGVPLNDEEIAILNEDGFQSRTLLGSLGFKLIRRIVGIHGGAVDVKRESNRLNIISILLPIK